MASRSSQLARVLPAVAVTAVAVAGVVLALIGGDDWGLWLVLGACLVGLWGATAERRDPASHDRSSPR